MSAAARAEARRQAILNRGGDRLAKLTTTARGEGHPAYMQDEPSRHTVKTDTFLGEESVMPSPPVRASPAPAAARNGDASAAWTAEQQQEFVRALMAGGMLPPGGAGDSQHTAPASGSVPPPIAGDDPMAAMMSALSQFSGGPPTGMDGSGFLGQTTEPVRPKTTFEKLMPLFHLLATWILLAFFVLFKEPEVYEARAPAAGHPKIWQRWADLSQRNAKGGFGVQAVTFFWAFTTLQLLLHSLQILTKSNPVQPPSLVAMALPYLPPTIASIILNLFRYLRMFGMLLDDVAGLVLGIGIVIWLSAWIAG